MIAPPFVLTTMMGLPCWQSTDVPESASWDDSKHAIANRWQQNRSQAIRKLSMLLLSVASISIKIPPNPRLAITSQRLRSARFEAGVQLDLNKLTLPVLKGELKSLGLNASGKKADLVSRLMQHAREVDNSGLARVDPADVSSTSNDAITPPLEHAGAASIDFNKFTLPLLKDKLKSLGLKVSGKKDELVSRLMQHEVEVDNRGPVQRNRAEDSFLSDDATALVPLDVAGGADVPQHRLEQRVQSAQELNPELEEWAAKLATGDRENVQQNKPLVERRSREQKRQKKARIQPSTPLPSGFLVVHKPMNWTSQDVVSCVRARMEKVLRHQGHYFTKKTKLKVGHGGTLDPLATGLLVLGVGDKTKELHSYLAGAKEYAASAQLGAETDTQDCMGQILSTSGFDHVTLEDLKKAAASLTGDIMQRPSIYSAVRVKGRRMHELAREGKITEKDVEPRPVTVYRLEVTKFDQSRGTFDLDVSCSGGTYIRVIISDIGRAVGSAAHMTALERTKHGPFCTSEVEKRLSLEDSVDTICVEPLTEDSMREPEEIFKAMELCNLGVQGIRKQSDETGLASTVH